MQVVKDEVGFGEGDEFRFLESEGSSLGSGLAKRAGNGWKDRFKIGFCLTSKREELGHFAGLGWTCIQ